LGASQCHRHTNLSCSHLRQSQLSDHSQSSSNHLETPLGQQTAEWRWENTNFLLVELIRITRGRVVCMLFARVVCQLATAEPHKSSVTYHGIYRVSGKNQQRNVASPTPLSFCEQRECHFKWNYTHPQPSKTARTAQCGK